MTLITVFTMLCLISFLLADNTPISPSKIKSKIMRMKKLSIRSDFKEQKLAISKLFIETKSFLPRNPPVYGRIDRNNAQYRNKPLFEVYIRSRKGGIWLRLKDIACATEFSPMMTEIAEGGAIEETYRDLLEKEIYHKLLGSGMGGDKILLNEIVKVIPQHRKLKTCDIMIGYKHLAIQDHHDDNIGNNDIWNLNLAPFRSVRRLPMADKTFMLCDDVVDEIINDSNDDHHARYHDISSNITCILTSSSYMSKVYICSDGSATRYNENSNRYLTSAGVVIAAVDEQDQIISSYKLKIKNDGSIVSNPLDSELIGGLVSLCVLATISSQSKHVNDGMVHVPSNPIICLSDSKTLTRTIRQTIESTDVAVDRVSSNPVPNRPFRELLYAYNHMLLHKYPMLRELYSDEKLMFKWTPGHPEKRLDGIIEWTMKDKLIWTADELANIMSDSNKDSTGGSHAGRLTSEDITATTDDVMYHDIWKSERQPDGSLSISDVFRWLSELL